MAIHLERAGSSQLTARGQVASLQRHIERLLAGLNGLSRILSLYRFHAFGRERKPRSSGLLLILRRGRSSLRQLEPDSNSRYDWNRHTVIEEWSELRVSNWFQGGLFRHRLPTQRFF